MPAAYFWSRHYFWPWLAAGAVTAAGAFAPSFAERSGIGVFLASALLLGLPHGAADAWVPQWATRRRWNLPQWAAFLVIYSLAVMGTLLLWRWERPAAAIGFLVLTAWHWGSADASALLTPGRRWVALAVARGLVVVAGPLALQPAASQGVVAMLAGSVTLAAEVSAWAGPLLWAGVLLEAVTLTVTALENVPSPGAWRAPLWHGLETAGLLGMFYVLPPILSVGVYFMGFHAWRHIERLAILQAAAGGSRQSGSHVLAFYRRVWPFALAALALLPILKRTLVGPLAGEGGWLAAYLILLSALTVPHAALIAWLDRRAPMTVPPPAVTAMDPTRARATPFADTARP